MSKVLKLSYIFMVFMLILGCNSTSNASLAAQNEKNVTIAWMSDTQYYSRDYPEIFDSMTQWIYDNAEQENIKYTLITGDLVHNSDKKVQWENANRSIDKLGNSMPLMTLAGNHDMDEDKTYKTYLEYFGKIRYTYLQTVGGYYKDGVGRYDVLNASGKEVLLISLGYGAYKDGGIEWLNKILQENKDKPAILATHSYIYPDGSYTNDGKQLFEKVVKTNENLKLVLCGHKHGVYHDVISIDGENSNREVHQVLANYQDTKKGGNGYLCLLTFDNKNNQIQIKTYSPYKDDFNYFDGEEGIVENFSIPFSLS